MSRRFGRNQRRRMREQLAQADLAYRTSQGLLDFQRATNERLSSELNWARSHLAHYTFALHPGSIRVNRKPNLWGEMIRIERIPPYLHADQDDLVQVKVEDLPTMIARAKINKMNGDLHVKVVYADGSWAYALSRDAFFHQSEELLTQAVSQELAMMIIRDIRAGK